MESKVTDSANLRQLRPALTLGVLFATFPRRRPLAYH